MSDLNSAPVAMTLTLSEVLTQDLVAVSAVLQSGRSQAVYRSGLSVAHLAVHRGSVELLSLALSVGGSADAADDYGRTPLMLAAGHPAHVIGAKLVSVLLSGEANPRAADHFGNEPIHYAARAGNSPALMSLLYSRADIGATNRAGETVASRET